jgi:sodium-coupled monocarboxylate transporter 8/12
MISSFDLDPTKKDTFWLYTFGYTLHVLNICYLSQTAMQKCLTLPTFRDSVK